jgi:hypothetical protein
VISKSTCPATGADSRIRATKQAITDRIILSDSYDNNLRNSLPNGRIRDAEIKGKIYGRALEKSIEIASFYCGYMHESKEVARV